ncbi:flagellar biosynthetic protein FliR [Pseudidiomarina insulisalsae]|uniref:Flagellar biosynthetic protein FliR n=1 Tax=Pseudidiomarina insulisalsae TaxID=575789 RepID=A0A432YDH5_9GAMM|nr:flagellar biosynthetic protein FliR [Pseudidiomarina insulisalsae]RUO59045.1 flagellar biosynthetic protein FliR [Pseudidiomarina insulisalsae]
MLSITSGQLETWITLFFWPFCRFMGLFLIAPVLSHSSVPRVVKIGLCALLALALAPLLPPPPQVPLFSWASAGIVLEQLLIGVTIGFVLQVLFAAVQAAGEFIGLQMGLAFATFFAPDSGTNTMILSRVLYTFALLLFLAIDGHLLLIETLVRSFTWLPVGELGGLSAGLFETLARFGAVVFSAGILLALPVFSALLIVNLTLGILNRSAPQLTVFSVGFPLSLTLGMVLLVVLMTELGAYLQQLFQLGFNSLDRWFAVP